MGRFLIKQGPFTQNLAKQPNIFFVLKVLRIIFYPLKHPSQVQKLKNWLKPYFLGGHPVVSLVMRGAPPPHVRSVLCKFRQFRICMKKDKKL